MVSGVLGFCGENNQAAEWNEDWVSGGLDAGKDRNRPSDACRVSGPVMSLKLGMREEGILNPASRGYAGTSF